MLLVMSVCSAIVFEKPNFKNMMPTYGTQLLKILSRH